MMTFTKILSLLALCFMTTASAFTMVGTSPSTTRPHPLTSLSMSDDSSVHQGTVKWFDTMKGYGFIKPNNEDEEDVFVHQTAIQTEGFRSLADGEAVEYQLELDPKSGRRKAAQVTGPNGEAVQGAPFRPSNEYDEY